MKTKKIISLVIMLFVSIVSLSLTSCTTDEEKRAEAAKIVESRDSQDLLNELYLACDGDYESLARMLQVTPSSVERIRKRDTDATTQFEEKLKTVTIYYYQNDRKYSKLRAVLDPEYAWFDSVLDFSSHHPFWFWGGNIVLILILAFAAPIAIWPILLELLIYLVAWVASFILSPGQMQDKYVDTINPVVEQVLQ